MKSHSPTILAINPGTRYIGVAVLIGSDLIDWGVKVIDGKSSSDKLTKATRLVSRLIAENQPTAIATKRLHPSRTSDALRLLCQRIEALAKDNHLKVHDYSIAELEAFFDPNRRVGKLAMVESVCQHYPILMPILRREQNAGNPYHIRMFEAIALADVCFHGSKTRAESASLLR